MPAPIQTDRSARTAERRASAERIARGQAETRAIVAAGACPSCGGGIRANLAIRGWWQCAQYGAPGFRADATRPACSWQGFTE